MPDSAGTAFILASAALAKLGATNGAEGVVDEGFASLNVRYLAPVTKALEDELDVVQNPAMTRSCAAPTRGPRPSVRQLNR